MDRSGPGCYMIFASDSAGILHRFPLHQPFPVAVSISSGGHGRWDDRGKRQASVTCGPLPQRATKHGNQSRHNRFEDQQK